MYSRAVWQKPLQALGPVFLIAILGGSGYLAWPTVYAGEARSDLATLDALNVGFGRVHREAPTTITSARTTPTTSPTTAPASSPTTAASLDGRPPEACYELIIREDFDGPLGSAWQVYDSAGNHSVHAVRKAEAVSVVDGKLVITAANDAEGVAASGGLRHVLSQRYGKYAFSVRTDPDVSNTTSGVVLTWPVSENQSVDGENNMYETLRVPGDRSRFYSFIHKPFDELADGISQNRFVHRGDATQWQEITMEWAPGYVQVSWTNPTTNATRTRRVDEGPEDLITDAEHFLAIQLDLFKGSFPDDRMIQMEVDWVEVYAYCG